MSLEVEIIDLMDEDDESDGDEVEWIDALITVLHPEASDEKTKGGEVHDATVHLVENESLAVPPVLLLVLCET